MEVVKRLLCRIVVRVRWDDACRDPGRVPCIQEVLNNAATKVLVLWSKWKHGGRKRPQTCDIWASVPSSGQDISECAVRPGVAPIR